MNLWIVFGKKDVNCLSQNVTLLELTAKSRGVYYVASLAMKFVKSIHQVSKTRWYRPLCWGCRFLLLAVYFLYTGLNLHNFLILHFLFTEVHLPWVFPSSKDPAESCIASCFCYYVLPLQWIKEIQTVSSQDWNGSLSPQDWNGSLSQVVLHWGVTKSIWTLELSCLFRNPALPSL